MLASYNVFGPTSYIIGSSDLHPLRETNKLLRYADATYFPIGSNLHTAADEFAHIAT